MLLLQLVPCCLGHIDMVPLAFSSNECDAIVDLFSSFDHEVDSRINPLLPEMKGTGFGVHRVNRFDDGSRPAAMEAIHERVLNVSRPILTGLVPERSLDSVAEFSSIIDFSLLRASLP